MADIWFISDPHFGHANMLKFTGLDGQLIRPGFKDVEHMNATMIQNWNSVVKPSDKIYCLGDFGDPSFARKLNGHKRLILGNHDVKMDQLMELFDKVTLLRWWRDKQYTFLCTHYPVRFEADSLPHRKVHYNVHGHIHEKWVYDHNGKIDDRYINICVEKTNYTPLNMDELLSIMKTRAWGLGYNYGTV